MFDEISQLNDFWVKNFKLVLSVLTSNQFKTYNRSAILLNLILRVKAKKNIVSFFYSWAFLEIFMQLKLIEVFWVDS